MIDDMTATPAQRAPHARSSSSRVPAPHLQWGWVFQLIRLKLARFVLRPCQFYKSLRFWDSLRSCEYVCICLRLLLRAHHTRKEKQKPLHRACLRPTCNEAGCSNSVGEANSFLAASYLETSLLWVSFRASLELFENVGDVLLPLFRLTVGVKMMTWLRVHHLL